MFMAAQHRPSSAPGPGINGHFSSFADDLGKFGSKNGLLLRSKTPPDNILPIGSGPSFLYTRSTVQNSSVPTTPSDPVAPDSCMSSPIAVEGTQRPLPLESDDENLSHVEGQSDSENESESESERENETEDESLDTMPTAELGFTVEEVHDDYNEDGNLEVIHPDSYESTHDVSGQNSDLENDTRHMTDRFEDLHCSGSQDLDHDDEERARRRYERKKKRWSGGMLKRTHSQSIGSDTDCEDAEALDAHDLGSSARRLRRRVRGPNARNSLVFEDGPPADIIEVEEPTGDLAPADSGPPSLASDIVDLSQAWLLLEPMEYDLS